MLNTERSIKRLNFQWALLFQQTFKRDRFYTALHGMVSLGLQSPIKRKEPVLTGKDWEFSLHYDTNHSFILKLKHLYICTERHLAMDNV